MKRTSWRDRLLMRTRAATAFASIDLRNCDSSSIFRIESREHRNHIRACSPPGVTQQVDTSVLFMQRHNEFRSAGCLQSEAEYHMRSTKPTAAPRGKTLAVLRT
jgi:hypothetical protein